MDHLTGSSLFKTLQYLTDTIGPRPAGHPAEEQARQYLTGELQAAGIDDIERIEFPTIDSWGIGLIVPIAVALVGSLIASFLGGFGQWVRVLAGLLTFVGAYNYWVMLNSNVEKQWFYPFYKKYPGATLIAKLPAQEALMEGYGISSPARNNQVPTIDGDRRFPKKEIRHKVVLIGHTDSNKHRVSFSKLGRATLLVAPFSLLLATLLNGIAIFLGWMVLHHLFEIYLIFGLAILIVDDMEEFIDGANDNASAVSVVLGIGKHIKENPLKNTEVWLAFTGSEEVGLVGMNALLNEHGDALRDAYFIDFELVGAGQIIYVSDHSGFSPFSGYKPDPASVQLAEAAIQAHPDLGVQGRKMVINEEISTLRQRGFKGICLVGVGDDGWLVNWHRLTDTSHYIAPESLETAARFAFGMVEELDNQV